MSALFVKGWCLVCDVCLTDTRNCLFASNTIYTWCLCEIFLPTRSYYFSSKIILEILLLFSKYSGSKSQEISVISQAHGIY